MVSAMRPVLKVVHQNNKRESATLIALMQGPSESQTLAKKMENSRDLNLIRTKQKTLLELYRIMNNLQSKGTT